MLHARPNTYSFPYVLAVVTCSTRVTVLHHVTLLHECYTCVTCMFDTKCTHTFTFPLYVTDRNVAMLHFGSICKPVTVQLYVFVFVVSGPPIFPYFCQSLCSLFSSLCAFFGGGWALVRSCILSYALGCWGSPPAFVSVVGIRSFRSQCPANRSRSRPCSL